MLKAQFFFFGIHERVAKSPELPYVRAGPGLGVLQYSTAKGPSLYFH